MHKITSFKKHSDLMEFALAPSKSYRGMSKRYLSASIREGELIFDAIKRYIEEIGEPSMGHLLVLNDLDIPNSIKSKYPNIQLRITGQFTSQFRPKGDDSSWFKNKILKNPLKVWSWQYKNAFNDLSDKKFGKKITKKEWEEYRPTIHVGTVAKSSFVQEWIRYKQRAIDETFYYMSNINPKTFNLLTRNRAVLFLRGLSVLTAPFVSVPLNIAMFVMGMRMSSEFINDPLEAEAISANFVEMKRTMGQFNKNYFIETFGKRIVSKQEFIEKMVSFWNFQVKMFNDSNREKFEDFIYYEYRKEMQN